MCSVQLVLVFIISAVTLRTVYSTDNGSTCVDNSPQKFCDELKKFKMCTNVNYKKFIRTSCAKTCQQCSEAFPHCKDSLPSCSIGLKNGYCTGRENEVDFMKLHCKKSCNMCEAGRISIDGCGVLTKRTKRTITTEQVKDGARAGSFPWQVAIYHDSDFRCGGSLISKNFVVTAAHCFTNKDDVNATRFKLVIGEIDRRGSKLEGVKSIRIHPAYNIDTVENDIALMELQEEVTFSGIVRPICLPLSGEVLPTGSKCFISGWGKTNLNDNPVNILRELPVQIIDKNQCKKRNAFHIQKVTDNMICVGYSKGIGDSACHGDSGGPLSCERSPGVWTVFGVISWGSPSCNGRDRYTVLSKVSKYAGWINTNIFA